MTIKEAKKLTDVAFRRRSARAHRLAARAWVQVAWTTGSVWDVRTAAIHRRHAREARVTRG